MEELYNQYHDIDIALDPFPFSGGATTCDALWMGVPVITMSGETPVSRQTAAYLMQIGYTDLITTSKEDYVKLAVNLSGDITRLSAIRQNLRQEMAVSPLCNGERFARHLEAAFRVMWKKWCEGKSR